MLNMFLVISFSGFRLFRHAVDICKDIWTFLDVFGKFLSKNIFSKIFENFNVQIIDQNQQNESSCKIVKLSKINRNCE